MAHSQATKDAVRKAYVFNGLSLAMAAVTNDVSYGTAQRWKNQAQETGDDWDKVKMARSIAVGDPEELQRHILTNFMTMFKTTENILMDANDLDPIKCVELMASLTDSYTKAVSANKKMLPTTSNLAVALEVLERLANYIKEHKPELLMDFMDILEPFGVLIEKDLK